MAREAFRKWLAEEPLKDTTRSTQSAHVSRLEKLYGDLDAAYEADRFAALRAQLTYSKEDERNGRPNPSKLDIEGDLYKSLSSYRATLKYYARFRDAETSGTGSQHIKINKAELDALKQAFLAIFPDFPTLGFGTKSGSYWTGERAYKDQILTAVRTALDENPSSDEGLGRAVLNILQAPPSNFIGWRTFAQMKELGTTAETAIATAIGAMLHSSADAPTAAAECAERIQPLLTGGSLENKAYGQVRSLVTTALAFARPDEAVAVKTQYMKRAAKLLTGTSIFKPKVMDAAEYRTVLAFIDAISTVMREEWNWTPEDLWDVQGFLWITSDSNSDATSKHQADDDEEQTEVATFVVQSPPAPTNLILYGPPGTGKTYASAARAVAICDGNVPLDRTGTMVRYQQLVASKRISFVTFHQSYAYENFVEGLFPETSGGDDDAMSAADGSAKTPAAGGFFLRCIPGIFRQIADLAKENKGRPRAASSLNRNRNVFKMSLGRSADEREVSIFREAIKGGYVLLGWGGDIDWSAQEYDDFSAIKARWIKDHPDADGRDPNVAQLYVLRAGMREGDIVIVSDGNKRFRAIGEVVGPYQFVPRPDETYNHRRPVRWLWQSDKGQPRELIYGRGFSQVSAYQLDSEQVDWPALEQLIGAGTPGEATGTPEPYVLIIDEINRANISKVFGELITLIEGDKRLGQQNELTVTLPYSNERFGVPSNLNIVGTMNTADRSIALLDTALRRRFEFEELMPDPSVLADASAATGIPLGQVLDGINGRIEYLFDRDHQIGHAYFIKCRSLEDLSAVMRTKVIPLLVEYFYENWEKVRQVLGETTDDGAFIQRVRLKAPKGQDAYQSDEGRWRYEVRKDFPAAAYQQLV